MRMRFLALLFAGTLAASACADDMARADGAARVDDVTMSVQCSRNDAAATPCRFGDTVGADGQHTMTFVAGDKRVQFVGRSQSGWWSGKLDGKPAMGYELNRGHVVISTTDLDDTFEWWSEGNQHGSY